MDDKLRRGDRVHHCDVPEYSGRIDYFPGEPYQAMVTWDSTGRQTQENIGYLVKEERQ